MVLAMILAAVALLLLAALSVTQLTLKGLREQLADEKLRNDALRRQFERDTSVLRKECDSAVKSAVADARRWKGLLDATVRALDPAAEGLWEGVAELLRRSVQFRAVSVRRLDLATHNYQLEFAAGLDSEALERLRDSRVPETVVTEWMAADCACGPGFVRRARPAEGTAAPGVEWGSPMAPSDAWLVPLEADGGRVLTYASLAQAEQGRLPLESEMGPFLAALRIVAAVTSRRSVESQGEMVVRAGLQKIQMNEIKDLALHESLVRTSERLRSGLSHIEEYASVVAQFAFDMPIDEQRQLARVIVEEAQELSEDAVLVADLAELAYSSEEDVRQATDFSSLYDESLQFLSRRAENKGVTLDGPPLQGGIALSRPGLVKRILIQVTNELLNDCGKGSEIAISAWQDQGQVHIHWRAGGKDVKAPVPGEDRSPRWFAAQSAAHALGGRLAEQSDSSKARAVRLDVPLATADDSDIGAAA